MVHQTSSKCYTMYNVVIVTHRSAVQSKVIDIYSVHNWYCSILKNAASYFLGMAYWKRAKQLHKVPTAVKPIIME